MNDDARPPSSPSGPKPSLIRHADHAARPGGSAARPEARFGPYLDVALDLARGAGKAMMSELPLGLWRGQGIEHKSARELVSRVDRASEQRIVKGLREAFPDHAIQAEEGGLAEGCPADSPWRWLVDPLDGTTNFLHGHPFFCVSIALERRADAEPAPSTRASSAPGSGPEPEAHAVASPAPSVMPTSGSGAIPDLVAAVIYLPYFGEVFFAERGAGAYMNSRSIRLQVSPTELLAEALVTTGFAYDRERFPNFRNFERVASESLGIHRCGSAAIDLAFVAAGRYDAFWELGLRPHDVAAGALLVTEAGGRVTDFAGGTSWLEGRNVVASNGYLHEAVRTRLEPWKDR